MDAWMLTSVVRARRQKTTTRGREDRVKIGSEARIGGRDIKKMTRTWAAAFEMTSERRGRVSWAWQPRWRHPFSNPLELTACAIHAGGGTKTWIQTRGLA